MIRNHGPHLPQVQYLNALLEPTPCAERGQEVIRNKINFLLTNLFPNLEHPLEPSPPRVILDHLRPI